MTNAIDTTVESL